MIFSDFLKIPMKETLLHALVVISFISLLVVAAIFGYRHPAPPWAPSLGLLLAVLYLAVRPSVKVKRDANR